jgi:hypothetical protein
MAEMSPGTALRHLHQAQAGLKKARRFLQQARENPDVAPAALDAGWESLSQAHRLVASIPRGAVDEAVMTRLLAVQRYATALLVRLRRVLRNEGLDLDAGALDQEDDEEFD